MFARPFFSISAIAGLITALGACGSICAQDTSASQQQSFRYEVWGKSSQSPNAEEQWSESYPTYEQAAARMAEIYRDHGKGGLLETDPRQPIGLHVKKIPTGKKPGEPAKKDKQKLDKLKEQAKEAATKAREITEKTIDEIKERKIGETLSKYKDAVANAYKRAKAARDAQSAKVKNLTKYELDQVNNLIADYNKTRTNYGNLPKNAVTPLLAKYPPLSPLTPTDKPSQPKSKYTVDVFKRVGDEWQKQDDRTMNTDDEDKGRKYQDTVNAYSGWKATSNLPHRDDNPGLVGSEWEISQDGSIFGLRILNFTTTDDVVASYNVEASKFQGKWRSLGPGRVELTLRSGTYTATISGNQLNVSNVTLFKKP